MNYAAHYALLITKASKRVSDSQDCILERHHIVPRSLGGGDNNDNIVLLTIPEHRLAHLLLFRMGYDNQIFSVAAICQDVINKQSHRYKQARPASRYIRRNLAYKQAELIRKKNRGYNDQEAH